MTKFGCRTSGKDLGLAAHARRRRAAAALEGRRRHRVQLLRTYRAGELPDIQQVTLAAFLAPLGAQLPRRTKKSWSTSGIPKLTDLTQAERSPKLTDHWMHH